MSCDSKQEDAQQSDDTSKNDKKTLTFKDWKLLKESQSKTNEKKGNTKNNAKNKNYNRNNNNDFNRPRGFNSQEASIFFPGNSTMANNFNGINNFNNNNGMHNFNNNFGMRANYNNFGSSNNGFNQSNSYGFNNFNAFNNNNRSNNFDGNKFKNFNGPNPFGNDRNMFNGNSNGNNIDLPDNFFASDGMYRQKDFMQKPLADNNPFRYHKKADQLIQEFNKSRYTNDDKKTNKVVNNKSTSSSKNKTSEDKLHNREPAVYIFNPKARIDGKQYIPKPKFPEENLDISKEDKKQQWKEYREAMKPFKNREFYNAKRVVQRLGKIDPSELDEKQIIRLANARESMFKHKTYLSEKYANYEKTDDDPNDLGEVYVLKDKSPKNRMFRKPQNYGNFGENDDFESGRKILGGYTGFVPGDVLKGTDGRF